jgi:hypothetical protein
MLVLLASICVVLMCVLLVRSVVCTRNFLKNSSDKSAYLEPPEKAPRAVVVLPVRGQDPFLARCIDSLLNQDYSDYILRIVIDSEVDPAVAIVEQATMMYSIDRVQVEYLYDVRENCGAKNSVLLQVVESLEDEDSAIVVVDSDVVAYPEWLSDLMEPLNSPNIGAATGMRWYTPESSELGTLVRYIWNVGSIPEMHACRVPFGGSTAFRRDVLEGGLAKRWSECLFDDCVVPAVLKTLNLDLKVVPRAMMANRESISLGRCFGFLRRQMLNAICYNPAGNWLLAASLSMGVSVFGAVGVLIAAAIGADTNAMIVAGSGLATFGLGMAGCVIALERNLRPILRQSGQVVPPLPIKAALVGGLTVLMYSAATISAHFLRRVSWRGLNYTRVGHDQFRLEAHTPFAGGVKRETENASV